MQQLVATRLSLHAVAELLLAGPQYDASGTIRLQVTPGGFRTVADPTLRVEGTAVVVDDRHLGLNGRSLSDLADDIGVRAHPPGNSYAPVHDVDLAQPLRVDAGAARVIEEALHRGHEALVEFDATEGPVLWPEHFDVAISLDEVNYGVSAGDEHLPVPYAYVGPWGFTPHRFHGLYWNAVFGAARRVAEISDLVGFFQEGRSLTHPPA